jgi:hypothetical protein
MVYEFTMQTSVAGKTSYLRICFISTSNSMTVKADKACKNVDGILPTTDSPEVSGNMRFNNNRPNNKLCKEQISSFTSFKMDTKFWSENLKGTEL